MKTKMSEKDQELLEEAYSTTYRSTVRRLIDEAGSEELKGILRGMLSDKSIRWED